MNDELLSVLEEWLSLKVHNINGADIISAENKRERAIIVKALAAVRKFKETKP